jgi:UDP-glucose 6-dehydrogenase
MSKIFTGNIGIIGYGFVGKATYEALSTAYSVKIYDPCFPQLHNEEEVASCGISFICVPAPTTDAGVDTSLVTNIVSWLHSEIVVIRSTMPPDFDHPDNVVYQPEFIAESIFHPWKREQDTKLVVVGGNNNETIQIILDLWKPILGPRVKYYGVDWRTAAEVKYAANCFGAVKAVWWREFLGECGNPDVVRNILCDFDTVEPYYTLPIGESVGGKCLPKDLLAWVKLHPSPIGKAALKYMRESS